MPDFLNKIRRVENRISIKKQIINTMGVLVLGKR